MLRLLAAGAAALGVAAAATMAVAPPLSAQNRPARQDLADVAQGIYFGEVISDARGSSRSDVRVTVAKIGPNRVRISSDYPRLRSFEARLIRAMDTIQNDGGDEVFLLDLSRSPNALNVTVDDAAWAGVRQ